MRPFFSHRESREGPRDSFDHRRQPRGGVLAGDGAQLERRERREAGEDRMAPLCRMEREGHRTATRRRGREVHEEGRQVLRRREHRVPAVAGQGGCDTVHDRDQGP